ncbi:PAS domain S-box-containing protein/diguanylate cyclase (GGDEF) domain-containing protein [Malonomonas rubra DSM 5091]|uniref:PAS domain S-box-containing protein/diguanylate cyclase (GGDEF) domain-containing protein n=1 Tax=Malonomonas rubra DSM 5091 TaxID=1122189 RepID=A0A1M6C4R1_MALRU|nr:EAL domain-containing protein [Malonomonas rubra]SHI56016.1 PAS domain S-box-containing protein/diguanylate cyclase (GGDEF) domain-containing protein [Malonomonas rubra DSM 5091]
MSDQLQYLESRIQQLEAEKIKILEQDQELRLYIREKTDQLLNVIGTLPLKPEELDDETLISVDPIGIVSESFTQVLEHLQETNVSLALARDELQAIFNSAGTAILVFDKNRKLKTFNKQSMQLLFNGQDISLGNDCCSQICSLDPSEDDCIFQQVFSSGSVVENPDFLANGRHFHAIGTPIKNQEGELTHAILVFTDITEREVAEAKLRASEERYRTLFSTMHEGVAQHRLIYDVRGLPCDYEFLDVNSSCERILGLSRDQLVGKNASEIFPLINGKPPAIKQFQEACECGKSASFEMEEPESKRTFRISVAPSTGGYFASIFEDITQHKQDEEKIERLAYFDSLTGLPNRVLMYDRLEQMVARAKRSGSKICLLFFDLDHFKRVNDTFGHDTGDKMLQIVADRLRELLRHCDSICRLGGDEFVVLIDEINDREDAALIACKILEGLSKPIILKGKELYTSTSIGISMFPEDGDESETLIKNADTAMYMAKENGRNTFFFYAAEMNSQSLEQLLLANDLRKALKQNEFYLKFQPQIDLRNGGMVGIEAMLRWNHSDLGEIQPNRFIPLAEETGLILSIGRWVLHQACKQAYFIQQKCGKKLRVAVNLSAKQFQDPKLVSAIRQTLQETGLPAESLELEITESILMENVEKAQHLLNKLKQMGVRLAIDDFGTGYSSLSYLREFPIDRIKVDKSFIQKVDTHPDDAAIAKAIIVMGHIIGMKVVAEGVEQKEELKFLQQNDCDEVQGFYFSPPLTAEELSQRILNQPEFCFFQP